MHLVDGDRRAERLPLQAGLHPIGVAPVEWLQADDAGGRRRRRFLLEADRVGLEARRRPFAHQKLVFVVGAMLDAGEEDLPHAGFDTLAHGMAAAVPLVEVADHADAHGVRRPHREGGAGDAVDGRQVRAEAIVEAAMAALRQQIDVEVAEDGWKAVGVLRLPGGVAGAIAHAIGEGLFAAGDRAGEEAGRVEPLKHGHRFAGRAIDDGRRLGARPEDADGERSTAATMRPEDGEGVAVPAFDERLDRPVIGLPRCCCACLDDHVSPEGGVMSSSSPRTGMESQFGRLFAS